MEAIVNEHTPGQDFAVLMDIAPVNISVETELVLREEFVHIRIIMMSKGRMDANSRLLAADSHKKAEHHPGRGRHNAAMEKLAA